MQSSSHVKYVSPKGHAAKRRLRERGTLRCEWCNRRTEIRPGYRWSELSAGEWLQIADRLRPFFCPRPACSAARAEVLGAAGRATRVSEELKRMETKAPSGGYAADDTRAAGRRGRPRQGAN